MQDNATTAYRTVQETNPTPITVRLNSGIEVSGNIHVRLDSTRGRVSDVLNARTTDFIPITDATILRPDGRTSTTQCIIIGRDQVEMVLCEPHEVTPVNPPVKAEPVVVPDEVTNRPRTARLAW